MSDFRNLPKSVKNSSIHQSRCVLQSVNNAKEIFKTSH